MPFYDALRNFGKWAGLIRPRCLDLDQAQDYFTRMGVDFSSLNLPLYTGRPAGDGTLNRSHFEDLVVCLTQEGCFLEGLFAFQDPIGGGKNSHGINLPGPLGYKKFILKIGK